MSRCCRFRILCALLSVILLAGCGGGETITVDFRHAVEQSRAMLFEHSFVDLGTRTAGDEVLLQGWSGPFTDDDGSTRFATIRGERARLRLPAFDTGQRRLVVRCRSVDSAGERRLRLRLRLNGVALGAVDLGPRFQTSSLELPEGWLRQGENQVSFRPVEVSAPAGTGGRRVSADVEFVALTSESDGAAVHPQELRVDGDAVVQPVRSEMRFPRILPRRSSLEFGLDPRDSHGEVTARVLIRRSGDDDRVLFAADASSWPQDRIEVEVGNDEAQDAEVVFQVLANGGGRGRVAWRLPRLVGDAGDVDTATNVLLIVVDTLRSDMLSCYGGAVATPNLDALASGGVLFRRAYAHAPLTMPSHASMFTSLLPSEHGARLNAQTLAPGHLTLAELLQRSGRRTAGFVSLGVLGAEYGMAQGFDEYHDTFELDWWKDAAEMNGQILPWLDQASLDEPWFLFAHYSDPHEPYDPPGTEHGTVTAQLGGSALGEIALDGSVQLLSFPLSSGATGLSFEPADGEDHVLNLWQVRLTGGVATCGRRCEAQPETAGWQSFTLRVPAELLLRRPDPSAGEATLELRASRPLPGHEARRRYQAEVAFVDRELGKLFDLLRRKGLGERTLVVMTSDHGEGLGDHGLGGHVDQLYDSLLRVPLLVAWPGHLPAGLVIDRPVSHLDVLPTVADLLGLPDARPRRGRSLVPMMLEAHRSASTRPRPIFAETFRPQAPQDLRAVVFDGFKMIHTVDEGGRELYELAADPGELDDLGTERPELVERLAALLEARMSAALPRSGDDRRLEAGELEMLRALGYVE